MKKNNLVLVLGIVPICYMFLSAMSEYFNLGISVLRFGQSNRAAILTFVGVGVLVFGYLSQKICTSMSISAVFFALYMFLIGFLTNTTGTSVMSFVSCVLYWSILMLAFSINDFDDQDKTRISLICTITAILMSLIFIVGKEVQVIPTVSSSNSIYIILCAIPFCLVLKNKILKLISICTITLAILFSNKTTCLVALIIILLFFFRDLITKMSFSKKVFGLAVILLLAFITVNIYASITNVSIGNIFEDMSQDFSTGNGRYDIFESVFTHWKRSTASEMIFGHGFAGVASIIHIGAHNDFLEVLYDYGIIGLALYISFWIQLIKHRKSYEKGSIIYNAYISSLIIFLCVSLASNVINSQINMMFLIVFWSVYDSNNYVYSGGESE